MNFVDEYCSTICKCLDGLSKYNHGGNGSIVIWLSLMRRKLRAVEATARTCKSAPSSPSLIPGGEGAQGVFAALPRLTPPTAAGSKYSNSTPVQAPSASSFESKCRYPSSHPISAALNLDSTETYPSETGPRFEFSDALLQSSPPLPPTRNTDATFSYFQAAAEDSHASGEKSLKEIEIDGSLITESRRRKRDSKSANSSFQLSGSVEVESIDSDSDTRPVRKTRKRNNKKSFLSIQQLADKVGLAAVDEMRRCCEDKTSYWKRKQNLGGDPAGRVMLIKDLRYEIENSIDLVPLSRARNVMAFAECHRAYHEAQSKPSEFLQSVERVSPRQSLKKRPKNQKRVSQVKERFVDVMFPESIDKPNREQFVNIVKNWTNWGRKWFKLIDRFGNGILLFIPEDLTISRMNALKPVEFEKLLHLIDNRRDQFQSDLPAAERLIYNSVFNDTSETFSEIVPSEPDDESFILDEQQDFLDETQQSIMAAEEAISMLNSEIDLYETGLSAVSVARPTADAPATSQSNNDDTQFWGQHKVQFDEIFSSKIDKLLHQSRKEWANNATVSERLLRCRFWQSILLCDNEDDGEQEGSWHPHLQSDTTDTSRYHILPFFAQSRWRLAIFDTHEKLLQYFDSNWALPVPMSIFTTLHHWFQEVSDNQDYTCFRSHIEKDTPIAYSCEDAIILILWFVRQFIMEGEVNEKCIHWPVERANASRILHEVGDR